ncbi:hypothetical protein [Clostridium perfringens]|uniref:hypothetical protein n=1 Tax=Clostridium perfringens TaxID=1502 RepID=UPI000F54C5CC|nr:hypothetical protein [Clostridium perfringens]
MKYNNLYNFKNPVKNFLDIDNIEFPDEVSRLNLWDLCWTKPFNFRVKKQGDKYRTIKMPNILNFIRAYNYFKNMSYFDDIQSMDSIHKRLSANIETGDFKSGEYDSQLEEDFEKLSVFDNLIKIDIKEYYGRIYTHKLNFENHDERFLTCMNLGATNGLIMGNYLSLYFAELNLKNISKDIEEELNKLNIECEFSYFSDDFYFFCNKNDNEKIIKIFDYVLENYELERNDGKKEIWNYETFNSYNMVERYWKKIMSHCNEKFIKEEKIREKYKNEDFAYKLYFINQIIYRISSLNEEKQKKILINNFFKTRYFRELDLDKYQVKNYDYHQLCFIFKYSPEAMLYSIDKFSKMDKFVKQKVKEFFKVRYKEALKEPFNEEQLYFYYAIKLLGFDDIIKNEKILVLKSSNQILISYYLKDKEFDENEIEELKKNVDESYWFQNYHLILYTPELLSDLEDSINKYLMPENAFDKEGDNSRTKQSKERQRNYYMNFYKKNLELGKPIIRNIDDVTKEIQEYLNLKIQEYENVFDEETD